MEARVDNLQLAEFACTCSAHEADSRWHCPGVGVCCFLLQGFKPPAASQTSGGSPAGPAAAGAGASGTAGAAAAAAAANYTWKRTLTAIDEGVTVMAMPNTRVPLQVISCPQCVSWGRWLHLSRHAKFRQHCCLYRVASFLVIQGLLDCCPSTGGVQVCASSVAPAGAQRAAEWPVSRIHCPGERR